MNQVDQRAGRTALACVTGLLIAVSCLVPVSRALAARGHATHATHARENFDATPTREMQEVLDARAFFHAPPLPSLTPEQARNLPSIPDWLQQAAIDENRGLRGEPVAAFQHIQIPTRDGASLLARVYTPSGSGPFPVVVYYHGGGWVLANLSTYDASARILANQAHAIVVSVAYRQAPEHPFPTAANDAFDSYIWVHTNAATFGGDPVHVSVAGESAGGNLATVAALMARDTGAPLPERELLVYPITARDFTTASYQQFWNAPQFPLDGAGMAWFWEHYLGPDQSQASNPYASPLLATSLAGMPPTTILLAEIDPLRSDGINYAERLVKDHVPTTLCIFEGVTHEFFGMKAFLPEARQAERIAGQALRGAPISQRAPCLSR